MTTPGTGASSANYCRVVHADPPLFDLGALSRAIDQLRVERGMSMAELSREVGVAASTIKRFETATDAEADGVLALIQWLGVPPEDFMTSSPVGDVSLPATGDGQIRVDMVLVRNGAAQDRGNTRTTIQRLAAAALDQHRSIASLTRWSEV